MKRTKRIDAYTLTELLVVLVIIGILILLALPKLMPLVTRAHSLEAKNALKMVQTLEKTHFYEFSKYTQDLEAIGFEHERPITEDGGTAKYVIEISEISLNTFVARATSVVDFDGDGQFNVWEINESGILKEVVKD